jgi:hypothetical protein
MYFFTHEFFKKILRLNNAININGIKIEALDPVINANLKDIMHNLYEIVSINKMALCKQKNKLFDKLDAL